MARDENNSSDHRALKKNDLTPSSDNLRRTPSISLNWVTPLPTGTITFLFTDIEDSTPLWERAPQQMAEALHIHNAALHSAIEAHGGIVFKTIGDSINAAFPTAPLALKAAVEGQRNLNSACWNELGLLKVRMGLHTGEAELDPGGDEYAVSQTKYRVSRIMSAGHGGQILLSQECADLCSRSLPEDVILQDLGMHRMKGISRPEHLFQVVVPGLPADFPALQTLDLFSNNLPLQLTSFIGREKESIAVRRLLKQSRLLTLSGVGGTGKTRLALHVAGKILPDFEHGIWFAELARLTDPALILPTVAAILGYVEDKPGISLETRLLQHLSKKSLLLILDNCEHLILEAARFADKILRTAPQVKILVTSREALGIEGEVIYLVPSLTTPELSHPASFEALARSDAIRLFAERAGAIVPDFTLNQANIQSVAQICRRLDGIPLAIELAATRTKIFSTEQICQHLDNRFRLLTGGSRSALPRQQTLRATIDWSYGLLSEAEKALLRGLSVFMGGWHLAAAEAVCTCQDEEVFDVLAHLVDKSLVEVDHSDSLEHRYRMLETVRQYALEKLDEASESASMHDRHLNYFLDLTEDFEASLKSLKNLDRIKWLKLDLDNFRAALTWAFGAGTPDQAALGLRLTCALSGVWHFNDMNIEQLNWLKMGLELLGDDKEWIRVRAKTLRCLGWHCEYMDYNREAAIYARQSDRLYRQCDDPEGHAWAKLHEVFSFRHLEPEHPLKESEAENLTNLKECEAYFRATGNEYGLHSVLEAKIWCEEESKIAESDLAELQHLVRDTSIAGIADIHWGMFFRGKGELSKSRAYFHQALIWAHQNGWKWGMVYALNWLGDLSLKTGDIDQAQIHYEEALAPALEIGLKFVGLSIINKLTRISIEKGAYPQAASYLLTGFPLVEELELDEFVFLYFATLVDAAEKMVQPASAPRLLGVIEQVLLTVPWSAPKTREMYERNIMTVKARCDPASFQADFEAGKSLTREQVFAEARILVEEISQYLSVVPLPEPGH